MTNNIPKSIQEIAADPAFGNKAMLARKLRISRAAVAQWMQVPAGRAKEIERLTERRITAEQMRPDIFA